jgi:hypothetical protein
MLASLFNMLDTCTPQAVASALLAEVHQPVFIGLIAQSAALLTANPTWVDGAPVNWLYWNPGEFECPA